MFENILGQAAAGQLILDIQNNSLAPSLLFAGPPASAKGSSALELARVLSCENTGKWKCGCPSCAAHSLLAHNDLLVLGGKNFTAGIASARLALVRENGSRQSRHLFIRSLRKLLARFSPVIWEGDSKLSKINDTLLSAQESLEAFSLVKEVPEEIYGAKGSSESVSKEFKEIEKLSAAILKLAEKLESDGLSDFVPVDHIRRASYWSRLAPVGRHKTIIMENADCMKAEAANSLLKLLEEPPGSVSIVLTTALPGRLLPTIRSRLRLYCFFRRDAEAEADVLRRIFRDSEAASRLLSMSRERESRSGLITSYLESFSSVKGEGLYPAGAMFSASLAAQALARLTANGISEPPEAIVVLGKAVSPIAQDAGLGRPLPEISLVMDELKKGGFHEHADNFLRVLLDVISAAYRNYSNPGLHGIFELWRRKTKNAQEALVYNQNPALVIERLFIELKEGLVGLYS